MPIRPENKSRYPKDWKLRSRFIRFYRARNRCEWCGCQNWHAHPVTGSRVVLTAAHVHDHRPEAAQLLNLAALCQRCHNRHDIKHRARRRKTRQICLCRKSDELREWDVKIAITKCSLLILASLGLGGCLATTSDLKQYFHFNQGAVPVQKPQSPSNVVVTTMPASKGVAKRFQSWIESQGKQGNTLLGGAMIQGPMVSDQDLKKLAASVGGDRVLHVAWFEGTRPASRMVVGSYTAPSVSFTQANAYGYSSGSAYTSGSTPWGPMNFNTSGSANSFGTASATTYNPGSTTYVRENYDQPIFMHAIAVLQSPKGQLRNWSNFISYANANWGGAGNLKRPLTDAEAREWAAEFAKQHGVQLPSNLRSKTEVGQDYLSSMQQVDTNKDGVVSRKEFAESVVHNSATKYDANKDGVITMGEYVAGGGTASSFAKIDTKGRGKITKSDVRRSDYVTGLAGKVFEFSDKNRDGIMDSKEFETYKQADKKQLQKVASAG